MTYLASDDRGGPEPAPTRTSGDQHDHAQDQASDDRYQPADDETHLWELDNA